MKKIFVTQPSLPPLSEFVKSLERIWESKRVTNQGDFHQQFERELATYLGVNYVSLFSNGTLALVSALQVLRITGEVITSPFSFVATTHALHWNNIKPVFADIDPVFGNIDPVKIEAAITPKTTAILPIHVYGNPCDVYAIKDIADTYGLKVIYDACHAFGVKKDHIPIVNFGDLSVLSFHGTKVFNTMEGGAIVCHDATVKKRIDYLKNFGFANEVTVIQPGINAKMNEMQAALGILQLKEVDRYIRRREEITRLYRDRLASQAGIRMLKNMPGVRHAYSYFPIFITDEKKYGRSRDELYDLLKQHEIYGRRYFYPLISTFPIYRGLDSASPANLSTANRIACQVICLPIYPDLTDADVEMICGIITSQHQK